MLNCLGPDASTAPGPYTESKRRAEQIVLDHAAQGLPAVIVRPGGLIGPGDRRLTPPARMLLGLVNGTIRGYLDTYLWLQDVRDVARSVVHQTRDLMTGSVASISSHPVAFRALMDELHRLTGLPMPRLRVSRTVALAAAHLEELLTRWRLRSAPTASLEGIRVSPSSRPAPWDGPLLRTPLRPLSRTLSDTLKDFARRRLLTPRARAAVNDRCGAKSGTLSPEKFR